MRLPCGLGHLTFCTNIFPAQTWSEVRRVVCGPVREVRELEDEVARTTAEATRREEAHAAADRALEAATQELENLRNRHHTAALAVANHEKDLERTEERVKRRREMLRLYGGYAALFSR